MFTIRVNQILDVLANAYDKLQTVPGTPVERIPCPPGMRSIVYERLCRKVARSEVALARYVGEGLDRFEGKEKAE